MPNAIGTNAIEPITFSAELEAAGLKGVRMSWGSDGVFTYDQNATSQQKAAVEAVYAAHNPVKGALKTYANELQWRLATGGFTVEFTGGKVITFDTSTEGQALITGKVARLGQPSPPTSVKWQSGPEQVTTITAAQFKSAAVQVADYVQATFDKLGDVLAAINAGTITSKAQVDAAAWPSNTTSGS